MRQLFLDCDGVLADFDAAARRLFHTDTRKAREVLGEKEFWRRIRASGEFYRKLPLMPDALELYSAVAHLHPAILTGCPLGGWAEPQKMAWAAHHFPAVPMITCASREKFLHMRHPGDVLVDDFLRYKDLWEQAGGIFVQHVSARDTLRRLRELGFEIRAEVEA
ncbi:MAG: hypothetical protein ACLGPM_04820 [Acidobacteriota bacterium]